MQASNPVMGLTKSAVAYGWRQLAARAGVKGGDSSGTGFEPLGVAVHYAKPAGAMGRARGVYVAPGKRGAWEALLRQRPHSLEWLPWSEAVPRSTGVSTHSAIPILIWSDGCQPGKQPFASLTADGNVVFHADILASALFMLTRWEESVSPGRDQHGRFPGVSSTAYKQGFLERPIVDEYALILREWLKVLVPGWEPKPRAFSVKLSHDVDNLRRFRTCREGIRTLGGDLLKRRSLRDALQTGAETLAEIAAPHRTSYAKGIRRLARLSEEYGIRNDAFYFMAAPKGELDGDYELSSRHVRRCIGELQRRGFEIGLHASYRTVDDAERLREEKARLDALLGSKAYGGRCHYLRVRVPDTWRSWERAGLAYDSSMGYADQEGFRCGTCHPFRPFDLDGDRQLDIWERPLIVMDSTLFQYRSLTPDQAEARCVALARRCKDVEGTFTLLWHNCRLEREWAEWGHTYRRVLRRMAELGAGT